LYRVRFIFFFRRALLICIIIYPLSIFSINIELKGVVSKKIFIPKKNLKKTNYEIKAKRYIENFSKKNKLGFLLNRKLFMLKYNYYDNGIFKSKKVKLFFKKAYILLGRVHLFEVKGMIDNSKIIAKEVIFDEYKTYILKKCEVKKNKHTYRRKEFKLKVK